ncbi:MAG: hypothetical protein Q8N74_08400 [Sulfuricella sp.]|nr:hypothetical protein [Sulfuricella sp.]
MKIDSAEMILSSTHSEKVEQESSEQWKVVSGGRWLGFDDVFADWKQAFAQEKVGAAALQPISAAQGQKSHGCASAGEREMGVTTTQMLLDILDGMLPRKATSLKADDFQPASHGGRHSHAETKLGGEAPPVTDTFTMEFRKHEKTVKSERVEFSAAGAVNTADGRQISLHLNSIMSRQETSETEISGVMEVEKLKDPLVVNLDGKGVRLSADRFAFDLEGLGRQDEIPAVAAGSGFLVLDANGNGRADSGLELFGTRSGNGFADLAAWDEDRNRWIDENDSVFGKLNIWRGGEEQPLETLAQRGVGAIYLGNAATEFSLLDRERQLLGKVRATGVFLKEDGTPGVLQQIDLAV